MGGSVLDQYCSSTVAVVVSVLQQYCSSTAAIWHPQNATQQRGTDAWSCASKISQGAPSLPLPPPPPSPPPLVSKGRLCPWAACPYLTRGRGEGERGGSPPPPPPSPHPKSKAPKPQNPKNAIISPCF